MCELTYALNSRDHAARTKLYFFFVCYFISTKMEMNDPTTTTTKKNYYRNEIQSIDKLKMEIPIAN